MKHFRCIFIVFLLFGGLIILPTVLWDNTVSAATRHVGSGQPYAFIQDAINASSDGDTVFVHDGTYNENITINAKLSLVRKLPF